MSQNGRLGRGLASLIPDSALGADAEGVDRGQLRHIPLEEIRAGAAIPAAARQ